MERCRRPIAGRLLSRYQHRLHATPDGKYEVHIDRTSTAAATASGAAASQSKYDFKPLFAELDAKLPYRVTDKPQGGNPGDLVNFVIVGTQDQVTDCIEGCRLDSRRQDQHRRSGERSDGDVAEECLRRRAHEHSVPVRPGPGFRLRARGGR